MVSRSALPDGQAQVWIGLVEVAPGPQNRKLLDSAEGGFTNALALCSNREEFISQVSLHMSHLGFRVAEIEDAEPLATRVAQYVVTPELLGLALDIESTGGVRLGTFHTYPEAPLP